MVTGSNRSKVWWGGGFAFLFVVIFSFIAAPRFQPATASPISQTNRPKPATVQMTGTTIQKTTLAQAVPAIDLRVVGGTYPGCQNELETPVVNYKIDQLDLTGFTLISTCGWKADETVKITLMYPDGRLATHEVKAISSPNRKNIYQVNITFQPGVDAPEGKYRFTLQGSTTILKTPVFFNKPVGAKLYADSSDPFNPVFKTFGGQHSLRLEGFLPNEAVKLLIYRMEGNIARFYAWQDTKTDGTGRLIIETNLPEIGKDTELNFSAYGQETHSVQLERFSPAGVRINRQFELDLYCPGAQTPRLTAGNPIKVVTGITQVNVHQQPGYGSRLTIQAPADSPMRIYDQPKCIDHAYWWKVWLSKPALFGWIAESYLGKYQVEPAQ